jgi:hypothetical protein
MTAATQTMIPANPIRIPVVRASGKLERLPWGWDAETGILTLPQVLREAYLAAVECGAEFDPERMVAEVIGEGGEGECGGLTSIGASGAKFCVHITLPVLREGEIRFQSFRQCEEGLMEVRGDGEDAEGRFYGLEHGAEFSNTIKDMQSERRRTVAVDLRDFPGEVQDMLRKRAIKEMRPVEEVIADYVVETARMIVRRAEATAGAA